MQREYFFHIDKRGRLVHDGTEMDEEQFLHIFFRLLRPNETGQYPDYPFVSPCGREMNYVQAQDVPLVFHRLTDQAELLYAPDLSIPFKIEDLRFSHEGVLYHKAPVGGFGRIGAELAMELALSIHPWGPYYAFEKDGQTIIIPPLTDNPDYRLLQPRRDNMCYGCGGANPWGLGLTFLHEVSTGKVYTWLLPDERMQGAMGWVHGGLIALLLDEVMGKVLSANALGGAPTARLNVSFRRPARLGIPMELCGWFQEQAGRKYSVRGELRETHDDGTTLLLAEGEGLFIRPATIT